MEDDARLSNPIRLRVWGEGACFTRPEMKVERVSYEVMTPSAARGVLEAILWKPEMHWQVLAIDVLHPIQFAEIRRNEVDRRASPSTTLIIEDARQQRAMLYLVDVAYTIHAAIELTDKAGPDDTLTKYHQTFIRRASKGQCFSQPYLGTREFAASFKLIPDNSTGPQPIDETRDLGFVFYDFDYAQTPPRPQFFHAQLDKGRLKAPDPDSEELRA